MVKEKEQYIIIYDWMTEHLQLSGNERMIYALLYGYCKSGEWCTVSQEKIAKRIGATVVGVTKSIDSLLMKGYIKRVEIKGRNGKAYQYNISVDKSTPKQSLPLNKVYPQTKLGSTPKQSLGVTPKQSLPNNKDNNKKNNKGKLISKDIIKKSEKELIFDDGMKNAYPRVMHMPKPLTYEQYNKLLERYSKEIIRETLEAMENYRKLDTYDSAYRTLNNWLKRNLSQNKNENNRRNNPIDNIDRAREQAIRESMELIRKAEERNTQV